MKQLDKKQQKLCEEHLHVAETEVAEFSPHFHEHPDKGPVGHDDIQSEAYLALAEAASRYDPDHPNQASFHTYARHRIRGHLLDMLRRSNGVRKHNPLELATTKGIGSYEDNQGNFHEDDVGTPLIQRDRSRSLHPSATLPPPAHHDHLWLESLMHFCTAVERQAIELTRIQGYTDKEASEQMGVCRQRVTQARKTGMARMKKGKAPCSQNHGK